MKAANGLYAGLLYINEPITDERGTTIDNPYIFKPAINDKEFVNLKNTLESTDLYIELDLSDSTITTIPDEIFNTYDASITEDCKFIGNDKLVSVILPNSVTTIGHNAFSKCANLTSITMNGVTEIEGWAFEYTGLISVDIPNSVTSIGYEAFRGCTSLTSVTIPNSVTSIAQGAFVLCTNLANITIGNKVESIGGWAFSDACITSITIPSSVKSIGDSAFNICSNLTEVTFAGTIPSSGFSDWAFMGNLYDVFYATNKTNGTPGTYTATIEMIPDIEEGGTWAWYNWAKQ